MLGRIGLILCMFGALSGAALWIVGLWWPRSDHNSHRVRVDGSIEITTRWLSVGQGVLSLGFGTLPPATLSDERAQQLLEWNQRGLNFQWTPAHLRNIALALGSPSRWLPSVLKLGVWTTCSVPLYLVIMSCAAWPLLHLSRTARHGRRLRRGLCMMCGYDLQGSEGTCPECGHHEA